MSEHGLSYQEVIPDQTLPVTWKEIDLNTGNFTYFELLKVLRLLF